MEVISVKYQEHEVGAVSFNTETGIGSFQYDPTFINTGIELSPLKMPLSQRVFSFPEIDHAAFKGLPGMIADSLPDDFGNVVMNAWIASQGKSAAEISPLQRLQYTGKRGMGALTYHPAAQRKLLNASQQLEVESLVGVAQDILDQRENFSLDYNARGEEDREAMMALMSIGTSAGGARPKAVVAFNEDFTKVRSGQTNVPEGFTHFIIKFDGVSEHNTNRETFGDPMGFGAMEYVYSLIAKACGIEMMPCRLLPEGDRRHFITQRYDRVGNKKRHVQTLNGLAHVSYKQPGSYSYAELFTTARELRLQAEAAMQIFKRMVFNVVGRNHDDHSKNFGFILGENHQWELAPAYDLAYSYKPGSPWVNSHWMILNNKRDNFTREDFYSFEKVSPLFTRRRINQIVEETTHHFSTWFDLAKEHGVPRSLMTSIGNNLRLAI